MTPPWSTWDGEGPGSGPNPADELSHTPIVVVVPGDGQGVPQPLVIRLPRCRWWQVIAGSSGPLSVSLGYSGGGTGVSAWNTGPFETLPSPGIGDPHIYPGDEVDLILAGTVVGGRAWILVTR